MYSSKRIPFTPTTLIFKDYVYIQLFITSYTYVHNLFTTKLDLHQE